MNASPMLERADTFCRRFSLQLPILLAPMAPAQPAADVLRGMWKQAQALLR